MIRTPTVFPEVLSGTAGQGWSVGPHTAVDGVGGWTDVRTKRMGVPLAPHIQAANIRAHELGHAKWTPSRSTPPAICRRHRITVEALQRAEDLRVGYALIDSGVTCYTLGALDEGDLAALRTDGTELMKQGKEAAVAKRLAFAVTSVAMTDDRGRLVGLAEELGGERLRSLVSHVAAAVEDRLFGTSRKRYVQEHRQARRRRVVMPFTRTIAVARLLDSLFPPPDAPGMPDRHAPPPKPGDPVWGTMTLEEPPRTVLARITRLCRTKRPTDEGAVLRRIDRLLTDGKVFAATRRLPGATVLIDGSGSMGWTRDGILDVVSAAPAATVAIYSGTGTKGILRTLIRKGHIVQPALVDSPLGCGNIIDGPALMWLATQPAPRIWVSDGHVTGADEVQHPALVAEALRIQLAAHITRLDDLPAAIAFFTHLRRTA